MESNESDSLIWKSRFLVIFDIWWWIVKDWFAGRHSKTEILRTVTLKSSLSIIDDVGRSPNVVNLDQTRSTERENLNFR
jgi:hypothetical protein